MQRKPAVHLNLNVRGMNASATVAINEQSDRLRAQGREVFKLGLGQSPFPVPDPVVESLRTYAPEKDYLPVKGLGRLREKVAEYHQRRDGVDATADDVLVGPGSKELMFLLQLTFYGDLVIPTPCWVSYAPQARIIGRHVRFMPTRREDRWRLSPEQFAALCEEDVGRPRIFILNYPSNPTGGTYRADELEALAKVAREHEVVLLSDEIYGELHHQGEHVSISRYYPEGTILSSGISKWCGAGGWRLGTFVFPKGLRWLLEAMAATASETYTSTSAPIQYAAVTAYEMGPQVRTYLLHARRVLGALAGWTVERLRAAGAECLMPDGAFYVFPDLDPLRARLAERGLFTSRQVALRLLEETGVAALPGSHFGRSDHELTLRLALVDFDGAAALAAATDRHGPLDEPFLRRYCPRTLEAIERLCEWLGPRP